MRRRVFLHSVVVTGSLGACATVPAFSGLGRQSPSAYLDDVDEALRWIDALRTGPAAPPGAIENHHGDGTGSTGDDADDPRDGAPLVPARWKPLLVALTLGGAAKDLDFANHPDPRLAAMLDGRRAEIDAAVLLPMHALRDELDADPSADFDHVVEPGGSLDRFVYDVDALASAAIIPSALLRRLRDFASEIKREARRMSSRAFFEAVVGQAERRVDAELANLLHESPDALDTWFARNQRYFEDTTDALPRRDDRFAHLDVRNTVRDVDPETSTPTEPQATPREVGAALEALDLSPPPRRPRSITSPDHDATIRARAAELDGRRVAVTFDDGTARLGVLLVDRRVSPPPIVLDTGNASWLLDMSHVLAIDRIADADDSASCEIWRRPVNAQPIAEARPGQFVVVYAAAGEIAPIRGWVMRYDPATQDVALSTAVPYEPRLVKFWLPSRDASGRSLVYPAVPNQSELRKFQRSVDRVDIGVGVGVTLIVIGAAGAVFTFGATAALMTAGIVLVVMGGQQSNRLPARRDR